MSTTDRAGHPAPPAYAGIHLVADFWHVRPIEAPSALEEVLRKATCEATNTPLEIVCHKFFPHGITGVALLSESHIAIHSWPEMDYVAIDIFTCGDRATPHRALAYLQDVYRPGRVEIREIQRGRRQGA